MRPASILLILMLAGPVLGESHITLKVYPAVSTAPATIRVTLLVPPDPHNTQVCLTIDGENYYRSSCWEHGAGAPYQTVIYYAAVPAGHYEVQAELTEAGHAIRTPAMSLRVVGMGDDPEPDAP